VIKSILFSLVCCWLCFCSALPQENVPADSQKQMAVTFDDLVFGGPDPGLERITEVYGSLLDILDKYDIQATGFANAKKLQTNNEFRQRSALLRFWLDRGHDIGNHTFSHPDFHRVSFEQFRQDIISGEPDLRELLHAAGRELRYFRYPMLHTGNTPEKKSECEAFLRERGYTNAPVTIDNMEFIFNKVYADARRSGDTALMKKVSAQYLDYMVEIIRFYEYVSDGVLGRQIRQILLLLLNEINGDHLDALLARLVREGYSFITLDRALQDPAYQLPAEYTGPAGVTWLYRWNTSLCREIDWKKEPPVPENIMQLYKNKGPVYWKTLTANPY